MDIISKLQNEIAKTAGVAVDKVQLEHPEAENHGDYSTNLALVLKGGRAKAEEIAGQVKVDFLEKVEVAGPGFINFKLKIQYLVEQMGNLETRKTLQGKKVMVEFTDPNPFKEFHIGHLYSNIVGESLSRLLETQGAEVRRVTYQGDVGLHVAKSVWGMQHLADHMPNESDSLAAKAAFLGKAYAMGASKYEEDAAAKSEMVALNKQVYEQDPQIKDLYALGKRWSLEYFDRLYNRLGSKFVKNYFESEAGPKGLELVKAHLGDGIFEKSDGAVVFKGEKYGLHTRVFINSQGLPTYEAKELGLAPTKYQDFAYDQSIIVTGNEITEYFKVLLKALGLINPELAKKTTHIAHGMLRLPSGKMSSRTGHVITGEWLLDEAASKVKTIAPNSTDTEAIGQAAVKYALLKSNIGGDVEFDFDESVSFTGNSGPYLQYTYARTQSVLKKSDNIDHNTLLNVDELNLNAEELSLLRWLYRFGEVVEEAAHRFSPNLVAAFLYELAQRYNTFYNKHSILQAENEAQKNFRLQVTTATGKILHKGLGLLGIVALDSM